MRDVYACSFALDVGPGAVDPAFGKAAESALAWAFERYESVPAPDDVSRGRWERGIDYAEWTTLEVSGHPERMWSLVFFQQDAADRTLGWRTTIQVARERDGRHRARQPAAKGGRPKEYGRPSLDKRRLGELIDLTSTIGLRAAENRSNDLVGGSTSISSGSSRRRRARWL